ncbi:MAG: hypothetical protein C0621_00180 [Desulfuromonas sp.]|nr:MAG: hypothetical protein C0621_00180 [Desulfuromonas sp.]
MAIEAAFNLPFEEAAEFFRKKLNIPTERWDDLWGEQHAKGFMVAGAMQADLLNDFSKAVDQAITGGGTLETFRKNFDGIVEKNGWEYNGGRNWRSKVIYETNVRSAYQAGRWKQLSEPSLREVYPYLEYRHGDSLNPRADHLRWDGTILSADDPWWSTHYPQNGWGCKCKVFAASLRDLARAGKTEPDKAPTAVDDMTGIDEGWGHNAGMGAERDFDILADKAESLNDDIAFAWAYSIIESAMAEKITSLLGADTALGEMIKTITKGG